MLKDRYSEYKDVMIFGLIAVIIGLIVGAIDALFGRVLLAITEVRNAHVFYLLPFLPFAGLLIITIYSKRGKNSIKGMSLLFGAAFKEEENIPKRLIPFVIFSTWITHLFGGSAGREGVAVQIGGTVGHTIGRKIGLRNSTKILLITGMAAGFAGLFQTPIAAVFFAMEIFTVGILEYTALFPSIIAAFTASFTSHILGLEKFGVNLNLAIDISVSLVARLVFLGILFGITGGLFAHLLQVCKGTFGTKFKNPLARIFIVGCILSILLLLIHQGRYSGLGTNIINACFNNGKIYSYDWILKFVFTIVTLAAGFQGGEVTPLFSIGACLGAALSLILGVPLEFAAALGYTALFGSATNTILAPVFIGAEVFGYQYLPYFFLVCALAYVFNGNKSIYTAQRQAETL